MQNRAKDHGGGEGLVPALRPTVVRPGASPGELAPRIIVGAPSSENQFAHFWGVILDHKLLVATAILVPLLLAGLVAALQPAGYRAVTTMELLMVNQNFLNLRELDPNTPLSSTSDRGDSYTQTQLELLKRDVLVERVVRKLKLDRNPRFVSHRTMLHPQAQTATDPAERIRAAVETAQKKLRVQQLRQSNLVEVSFLDANPKLCVDFVNTLAQAAVDENTEARTDLSRSVGRLLEQQLSGLREKLSNAEQELQNYSAETGLVPADEKTGSDQALLQKWEDQLAKVQTDRIHKQSQYLVAQSANPDALPEVLDDPALKEYKERLADLRRQEADLETSLTADHPKVQRVKAQIADLQTTIAGARTNILNRLRNEYTAAQQEERSVDAAFATQTSKASLMAQKEIHYDTLKRELETTQSMYEDMLKRVNDAELGSVARTAGIRIVDTANTAEKQNLMQTRVFIGGIGLFSGFLLAGLLVFVLDQTANTVQEPGHMPALLRVPELGIIPAMRKPGTSPFSISSRPPFEVVDSFHSVITSILFTLEEGKSSRLIAVSSPGPGEGKTTVTANLGKVLSEVGHRVLLIDADVRMASLHKMFGIDNHSGFADILLDSKPITSQAVECHVRRVLTPSKGCLDVITAGEGSVSPFSLGHTRRATELVATLRDSYDLILLDTPPLLLVPESRVIGRIMDWCILVLRAGKTTLDAAIGAQQRMAEDGIPLMGTILNDCHPRRASYRYYGGYGSRNG
jgi:polysaccharide biosynthesis transport protein